MAWIKITKAVPGWSTDWDEGKVVTVSDETARELVKEGIGEVAADPTQAVEVVADPQPAAPVATVADPAAPAAPAGTVEPTA